MGGVLQAGVHAGVPIGAQFGRLVITGAAQPGADGRRRVTCKCSCGAEGEFSLKSLKNGNTTSCGCFHKERLREVAAQRDRSGCLVDAAEIVGAKFGRLAAVGPAKFFERDGRRLAKVRCLCDCGKECWVTRASLVAGRAQSCGCSRKIRMAALGKAMATHGHAGVEAKSATYRTWCAMHTRCHNPNSANYHNYGGRGIEICERWSDFRNFLADMGEKPVGLTIERINNDRGYGPGNCKWATHAEQAQNRRATKITLADAVELRRRHQVGGVPADVLAADYGLSVNHARDIAKGRRRVP